MRKAWNKKDLTGKRFGKLYVIKETETPNYWLCQCDCGKQTIQLGKAMLRGKTSCGCKVGTRNKTISFEKRNEFIAIIGKQAYDKLNIAWNSMKRRCSPVYHDHKIYYDRGISICEEWKRFDAFAEWAINNGYSEGLTLDRIDNDKGYEPSNCRWESWKTQQNNKRNNVMITYMGKTQTMSQWCDELGLSYNMVRARRRNGWKVPRLFEAPNKNQYA